MTILNSFVQKTVHHNGLYIKLQDPRSFKDRILGLWDAFQKETISQSQRKSRLMFFPQVEGEGYRLDKLACLTKKSERLIVLIHGLNASPLSWRPYLEPISSDKTVGLFVPHVYKKGVCKADEAAKKILEVVQVYANQNPLNPIHLVGHSRGASIAAEVEKKFNGSNPVQLISIAGSHLGSRLMKWVALCHLEKSLGIPSEMLEEMQYKSLQSIQEVRKWQSLNSCDKKVTRVFIATAEDYRIFPIQTSFPNLPSSTYFLLGGDTHVTVIDGAKEIVLKQLGICREGPFR